MNEVIEVEEAEKQRMLKKCEKIIKHGINVFIDRQLIYNLPEQVSCPFRSQRETWIDSAPSTSPTTA